VVGTCRPEELDQDCPLTSALPTLHRDVRLKELELGPLNEAETATLATGVSGQAIDPAAAAHLHHETEGNPLFVVESLRAGLPARQELADMDVSPLPPRVQAVLVTRLAQLSDPARELAGLAATIGRQFTVPLLLHAGDAGEEGLARGLDELWRRRIVHERAADAYDFSHDKLREAAYTALSPARRRLLHRRIGQALESAHASHLAPVSRQIAAHYRRGGLPAQAIPYYLRAGELAKGICAQDEAIACFQRGLDLLEEGTWDASRDAWCSQMVARFHEGLGDVLAQLAQPGEAQAAYQRALEAVDRQERISQSRLHRKISGTLWPQGDYQKALEALDRAEAALGPLPEEPDTGWTAAQTAWWLEWSYVLRVRGMVQYYGAQVNELAEGAAKLAQAMQHCALPFLRASHWQATWSLSLRRERYVVSAETAAGTLAAAIAMMESGDPEEAALAEYGVGWAYQLHGDLDVAEEHLQVGLALAERTGHLVAQTWILTWLSVLHRQRGEMEATRVYALRGLQTATAARLLENAGLARGNLAWLAWREGDLPEVEAQAHAALELWQQSAFVYAFHWTARFPLLAVALTRGQVPEALDHARAMLQPLQQRLPAPLEAALEAAIQTSDDEQAELVRQHLERVVEAAQETGYL
jgi:tetratricopeptide (TPR) repeat protein